MSLTDADREAWAAYTRANARAAEQYAALPIAHWTTIAAQHCRDCGSWTYDPHGVCWACRGVERRRT